MDCQIYRIKTVCDITGLPKSTVYATMLSGEFPRPIKLGRRAVGWKSEELQSWIAKQSEAASL